MIYDSGQLELTSGWWIWEPENIYFFKMFEKPSPPAPQHNGVEYSKTDYTVMGKVAGGYRKSVLGNAYLLQRPQAFIYIAIVMDYKEYPHRWGRLNMKWIFFKKNADNQGKENIEKHQQEAFWDLVIFHVLLIRGRE